MERVVVVGASLAGVRAVESLRRLGFSGSIALVGDEVHRPYDRPPLSKQLLLGTWESEQVMFRRKQGFEPLDVDLRTESPAVGLDTDKRLVQLKDGEELPYDGLIITTGAHVRTLPGPLPSKGVHYLRTLDDALSLRADLTAGKPRVAIVGAGFIGLEVASVARQLGLSVTVIEVAETPLARLIGEPMGQAVVSMHEAEGVSFVTGVSVERITGGERVEGIVLSDGRTVPADVAVVGIGVVPCTDWLQGSAVALKDGVLCDSRCATNVPDVVAAGDVARFFNPRFGIEQRVEHWTHAVEMAGAAVNRLLKGPEVPEFAPVPYFWSDQYKVKIQFAGNVTGSDPVVVIEGSPAERKLTALYERDGRLTGVLAWNQPSRLVRFRQAIAQGKTFEEARAM